jgi:hypothetical protein
MLIAALAALVVFAAVYAILHRRSDQPVRYGWLATIVGCAAIAIVIGALTQ